MNDSVLAKLVVRGIVSIAPAIWLKLDRSHQARCSSNCPTDISASRK
jgi:hypothetical protein